MAKHTHRGTCQSCGREQAVKADGTLANHGYTVQWGWQAGTCSGSGHAPLEHSRKHTDATIGVLNTRAADLEARTSFDISRVTVIDYRTKHRTAKMLNRAEYEAQARFGQTWDDAVRNELTTGFRNAKAMREFALDLAKLAERVHGRPLTPVVAEPAQQKLREEFKTRRDAQLRANELAEQGWRTRVAQNRGWSMGFTLTATKAGA